MQKATQYIMQYRTYYSRTICSVSSRIWWSFVLNILIFVDGAGLLGIKPATLTLSSSFCLLSMDAENRGQIHSPWLGVIVNSGIGLSYLPTSLCIVAGRYDNPMPESTLSLPVSDYEFGYWSQILSPWLGDIADSGIGLSYRPACLCQSWLYPSSQGLWTWLKVLCSHRRPKS
jgi:hypothetical protein